MITLLMQKRVMKRRNL